MKYIHRHTVIFLVLDLRTDALLDLLINQSYPIIFKCEAYGEPMPNISWEFNSERTSDASKYNISTSVNGSLVESSLAIVNPQSSDLGIYTCNAENGINKHAYVVLTATSKYLCCMHKF